MDKLGHVVVVGGSIAGLIAGRVLSDYFETVSYKRTDYHRMRVAK
jgi:flavin-dependent dehydrogenase